MQKSRALSVDQYHIMHIGFLEKDAAKFDCLMNGRVLFALLDVHTNLMPYAAGWRLCIDAKCLTLGHYLKLVAALGIARRIVVYLQVRRIF